MTYVSVYTVERDTSYPLNNQIFKKKIFDYPTDNIPRVGDIVEIRNKNNVDAYVVKNVIWPINYAGVILQVEKYNGEYNSSVKDFIPIITKLEEKNN